MSSVGKKGKWRKKGEIGVLDRLWHGGNLGSRKRILDAPHTFIHPRFCQPTV